jgi:hypothetical protein
VKDHLPLLLGLSSLWTLVLLGLTLLARFRFDLQARDLAARYARWTFGVRLHLAFPGILLLGLAPWLGGPLVVTHFAAFAIGLILSSALHHGVLRVRTGDCELHLCAQGARPADLRAELGTFTPVGALLYGLLWGILFEALTLFSRFGLAFESQRDTAPLRHVTFGVRIHHGYIGIALLFSDLFHHFAVLWPVTGTHQFFLLYD